MSSYQQRGTSAIASTVPTERMNIKLGNYFGRLLAPAASRSSSLSELRLFCLR